MAPIIQCSYGGERAAIGMEAKSTTVEAFSAACEEALSTLPTGCRVVGLRSGRTVYPVQLLLDDVESFTSLLLELVLEKKGSESTRKLRRRESNAPTEFVLPGDVEPIAFTPTNITDHALIHRDAGLREMSPAQKQ